MRTAMALLVLFLPVTASAAGKHAPKGEPPGSFYVNQHIHVSPPDRHHIHPVGPIRCACIGIIHVPLKELKHEHGTD